MTAGTLVIGIGNPYRKDDAAGLYAARLLAKRNLSDTEFLERSGEGVDLISLFPGRVRVIVFDAMFSGQLPGTVRRFDVTSKPLPAVPFRHSTHAIGLPDAIEMARSLGDLPELLVTYGIEGRSYEAGEKLSEEAKAAAEEACRLAEREILEGAPPA